MNNSALMAVTVLGGIISATLYLLSLYFLSTLFIPGYFFIYFFVSLPFFLLGLSHGLKPLYLAGIVSSLAVLLLAGPYFAANFFIFSFLGPTFLVNRALLNRTRKTGEIVWYPSSLLLRDLALASGFVMLVMLGVYLYFIQSGNGDNFHKSLLKVFEQQGNAKELEFLFFKLLSLIPGVFAFLWSLMMVVNGIVAQRLLTRFNRNLRPALSFQDLNAPKSFIIMFGISLLLSFVGVGSVEILGKNAAFVLTFPFFLVGLSLVHFWLHKTAYTTAGLTIFYFLLVLFFWPILFVILLGILKPWIEKSYSSN